MVSVTRKRDRDACPGALQVHQAADGALARVRLPGGTIDAAQLEALADAATRFGAGTLELTSRGNLQVRGVTDARGLADAVDAAGLLPSPSHERVRNIIASPLSGRVGGLRDVRPWVADLDRAICAAADLAGLPGRFMFSIDDGSADVSGFCADAGVQVDGGGNGVALLLAGHDTGVRLDPSDAVGTLMTIAHRFLEVRGNAWRVAELDDPRVLLAGITPSAPSGPVAAIGRPPVGWIHQDDGRVALGAAVPLGVLTARQAQFVAAVDSPVVVTPWRSLVVCDLEEGVADTALRVLAPLGLVFDGDSRWLQVSACVGSPGCARSAADVRAEATRVAESGDGVIGDTGGPVHYVGCERACGSPPAAEVHMATGAGYRRLPKSSAS